MAVNPNTHMVYVTCHGDGTVWVLQDESGGKFKVQSARLGNKMEKKIRVLVAKPGLDGGAMFGIVPKPLWNKLNPSDSRNRIELGLNCLLVETGDKNVLIDTGVWGFGDEKFKEIYKINWVSVRDSIKDIGVKAEDVDIVINSHLHWDHCGGNTYREGEKFLPSFPNAKYVIQEVEWEDATNPNERTQASYISESFVPLKEARNLKLINGDNEILGRASRERWLLIFEHDPRIGMGREVF